MSWGGEEYRRQERKDQEMGVLKGWEVGEIGGKKLKNKARKIGAGAGTAKCNSPGARRLRPLVLSPVLSAISSPAISST